MMIRIRITLAGGVIPRDIEVSACGCCRLCRDASQHPGCLGLDLHCRVLQLSPLQRPAGLPISPHAQLLRFARRLSEIMEITTDLMRYLAKGGKLSYRHLREGPE